LRLCHHTGAECFGGVLIGVVEQHRGKALAHVPFQVIGQHAKKDMRTDPIRQPVIHRANMQIDGFDAAEGAFDMPYVMPLIT